VFQAVKACDLTAEITLLKNISTPVNENGKRGLVYRWLEWLQEMSEEYRCFYDTLQHFMILPVTSSTCERAFSKMTYVKSKLRVSIKQDRLQWIMLPYIEQNLCLCL
jgi:hypothetical protein